MKVYDSFIFNDELDLLKLRLSFLNSSVDFFVLVESRRTLSGLKKSLYFHDNRQLFQDYLDKIIYIEAPVNAMPAWEYEYFQRSYIKEALRHCNENDWIIISDVDEIINVSEVFKHITEKKPYLIELTMYYYWFNVKTNATFFVNVFSPWKYLQDLDIGERLESYPKFFPNKIYNKQVCTGWHFSYLFGKDIIKYQKKIQSFSHQEYNTSYYLNPKRILKCVELCIDLFERAFMSLHVVNNRLGPILPHIKKLQLDKYLYNPSPYIKYMPQNIYFIVRKDIRNVLHSIKLFGIRIKQKVASYYQSKSV